MGVYRPGTVWATRRVTDQPTTYVRTYDKERIEIIRSAVSEERGSFVISRREARLLAKRINQCLDETRSR